MDTPTLNTECWLCSVLARDLLYQVRFTVTSSPTALMLLVPVRVNKASSLNKSQGGSQCISMVTCSPPDQGSEHCGQILYFPIRKEVGILALKQKYSPISHTVPPKLLFKRHL